MKYDRGTVALIQASEKKPKTGKMFGPYPLLQVDPGTRALLEARLRRWPKRAYVVVGQDGSFWDKLKGALGEATTAVENSPGVEALHFLAHPSEWPGELSKSVTNLWSENVQVPFVRPNLNIPFVGPGGAPAPLPAIKNPIPTIIKEKAKESAVTVAKNMWPYAFGAALLGVGYLAMTRKASPV